MRITGGLAKGILLAVDRSDSLRPATDYNRQALFASLEGFFDLQDCIFLDLFAGTGAYGLEAFSRGASQGTFVEQNKQRTVQIQKNIANVSKSAQKNTEGLTVACADVFKFIAKHTSSYDIVFIDPPYELYSESEKIYQFCTHLTQNCLKQHSLCVFETPDESLIPTMPKLHLKKIVGKEGKNKPKLLIYEYI